MGGCGSPSKKGTCEANHELVQRVITIGSSANQHTQEDVKLMMNYFNPYRRNIVYFCDD